MIRKEQRGDGSPTGPRRAAPAAGTPDARLLSPAMALQLQRTAGNRAVALLQRQEKPWVRTHSIGDLAIGLWTPEERRQQVSVLVAGLEDAGVDAAERETMERNLETFEAWGSAHGVEFTAADAFRLREVARAAATDAKVLATAAKEMTPDKFAPAVVFRGGVDWAVGQLDWAASKIAEAVGGAQSGDPAKLRTAGMQLTSVIAVIKAMAAYLGYVQVAIEVENAAPNTWTHNMGVKLEAFMDDVAPSIWRIRYLDPFSADKAAAVLLEIVPTWHYDFEMFVERAQDRLEEHARFLKILTIVQLALLAFDIWTMPAAGTPRGGGEPPTISGLPGGGAVAAGPAARAPA